MTFKKAKKIGAWSILTTMLTGLTGMGYNTFDSYAGQIKQNREKLIILEERERAAKEILLKSVVPQLKEMSDSLHFIKGKMSK